MSGTRPARRPGGRSARVRDAVHRAVVDLLSEQRSGDLTVAAVAHLSGVHQATIYRRWGSAAALVEDVAAEALSQDSPVADTGSLRGDLNAFAVKAAADLSHGNAAAYVRAIAAAGPAEESDVSVQSGLLGRQQALQDMLDRAEARGESAPTVHELLDVILAPMYFRVLMRKILPDERQAHRLVDRLLVLTARKEDANGNASSG